MPLSLTAIDEKIGQKRRALSEALNQRSELFGKIDGIQGQLDSLEAVAEPTAEQSAEKDKLSKDYAESYTALNKASDSIRGLEAEVNKLEGEKNLRVEHNRQEALANQQQHRQAPPENPATGGGGSARVLPVDDATKDHDLACLLRANYLAKQMGCGVQGVLTGVAGPQYSNERLSAVITQSGNPALIPQIYSTRLIELLRARTVVRRMAGLRQVPLVNGNLRMPRQTGASTAAYTGEMVNIAQSNPTTDQLTLTAKKLTALVVQSGELLRRSDPSSDMMVRDDLVETIARREDLAFIRGTQSATAPGGLKHWADAASATQAIAANATINLANVTTDLGKLMMALANADTPMRNPYFLFHPRTERYLQDLRDGNGNFAFPELATRGTLRGFPYLTTTQIPVNLGAGTNESEIYLVDASEFIIADTSTFELQVSLEAAYHDGSAVQAAFSQDAAVFRLITEHDSIMRHNTSVAYLSAVRWA